LETPPPAPPLADVTDLPPQAKPSPDRGRCRPIDWIDMIALAIWAVFLVKTLNDAWRGPVWWTWSAYQQGGVEMVLSTGHRRNLQSIWTLCLAGLTVPGMLVYLVARLRIPWPRFRDLLIQPGLLVFEALLVYVGFALAVSPVRETLSVRLAWLLLFTAVPVLTLAFHRRRQRGWIEALGVFLVVVIVLGTWVSQAFEVWNAGGLTLYLRRGWF
jgi:hypothetical protein